MNVSKAYPQPNIHIFLEKVNDQHSNDPILLDIAPG